MKGSHLRRLQLVLHLAAIAVVAFALRHYGWNWDAGAPWSLHPDERHMAMVTTALESEGPWLDTEASGMNPYNQGVHSYVYGTLPLKTVHALTVDQGVTDHREVLRVGRLLSALWSAGAVLALSLFTLRLAGIRTAMVAGWLYAFTVLSIQQARFYTVDSAGVFFATLCVGFGVVAVKERRPGALIASAALVGPAMACRLNLALLAFWVVAVALAQGHLRRDKRPLAGLVLGGALALLLFRVLQPYAFAPEGLHLFRLNPQWVEDVQEVRAITHGELEVPYTLQWIRRIPYLHALGQLAGWGMGWALGLLSLSGSLFLLVRHRHTPWHWSVFPALWALLLIGYHGGVFLHTLRYFLPAYPALILGGVLALRHLPTPEVRRIAAGLALAFSAVYALGFLHMYSQPHPRVEASQWLYQHLPRHGVVVSEHWDDALPLRLSGAEDAHRDLTFTEMDVYVPESETKLRRLLEQIDAADYLVLSSTRASHSLPRFPERYPVMARFYERLAQGETRSGLREVARFQRQPRLGGWGWDTLRAEEALRVYDHPLVRIYEKTPVFSADALFTVLTEDLDLRDVPPVRYLDAGKWNHGLLTDDEWRARQRDRTWHDLFPPGGIGHQAPVATWTLVLFFLGLGSYPLAWFLFPSFRDRGAGFSRLLGLLLISLLAWWPAATGLLPFDRALLPATVLVFGASALLFGLHHEALLAGWRARVRRLLTGEAVFFGIFFLFLGMRWMQPDLWHPWSGGEKPMDFAFLNATVLTPGFPAPNPWLSGAFINYYAYGFVWVAALIHTTGISPDIAYNLALPTFAALTAGAVFSLARAWTPWFRTRPGRRGEIPRGLLAVFLTLIAGNLAQLRWLLRDKAGLFVNSGYWNASRALRVPEGEVEPITEFPFFTHLYGDLHAHWMALPLAVFALAASWQLFRRFHPLRVALCALALGTLWCVNAWDVPVQAAIFAGCALLGILSAAPPDRAPLAWSRLGWILLAGLLAKALYLPHHHHTLSPPLAFERWEGSASRLGDLLLAHGLFLLPLALTGIWLAAGGYRRLRKAPPAARLLWLLLLGGCLLLIVLVERYTLTGDIGRMNTVFKFYYQIWWILALLTATLVPALLRFRRREPLRLGLSIAATGVLALGLVYPLTALPARWNDRYWDTDARGLDGLAYLETATYGLEGRLLPLADDLAGIRWLRRHARPFDILMEAHRPRYQWGARMSWHTGLPTPLGWNWHMRQQRPLPGADHLVYERRALVTRFYTTPHPEEARDILTRLRVAYVVVGDLEALTYGDTVRPRLADLPFLEPVFEHRSLTLYRVAL